VVQEIAGTRDRQEIGCDDCFEELDRFVTMQLAGLDTAEAMSLVQEHLHMCGECREEFEALLTALRATGEA
jgi:predicted anti-sigma-YlaC factor YlaD